MAVFEIRNVRLDIPGEHLTRPVKEALTGGYYEKAEHRALGIHLRSNDRMVDLGAGAGYLCCVASAIIGANNVLGVEAHPDMAPGSHRLWRRLKRRDAPIWPLHANTLGITWRCLKRAFP